MDLTKEIIEDIVAHIAGKKLVSQKSIPRWEYRDSEKTALRKSKKKTERKQSYSLVKIRNHLTY